ncbi:BQ5605_C007g04557 [Microbotryum silenes-dioicae]|uniref:BQ5605_C007g04557 protein n=1 Tax=Microbotryum silenes-dioicae TaxID=796604 RepID=A0A2X0M795_9BASI|nr:BQ5605_C007g04557 [Microbotryum silenes-dioicae]
MLARSRSTLQHPRCSLCVSTPQRAAYHPSLPRCQRDDHDGERSSNSPYVFTKLTDALPSTTTTETSSTTLPTPTTPSAAGASPSTSSSSSTSFSLFSSPLNRFPVRSSELSTSRRPQRQTLTSTEAATFADLLSQLLPTSATNSAASAKDKTQPVPSASASSKSTSPFAPFLDRALPNSTDPKTERAGRSGGLQAVRDALDRKTAKRIASWERRTRSSFETGASSSAGLGALSIQEYDRFDQMKEQLATTCSNEYEVWAWGEDNVWGPQVVDSISSTPLYAHLVLLVFTTLREEYDSPFTALQVFHRVSTISPISFVRGCGADLFNQVLETQWLCSQGDIALVAKTLERMRSSGVLMDHRTRDLVARIGEAVRIDGERAEARVQTGKFKTTAASLTPVERINLVDEIMDDETYLIEHKARYFDAARIEEWNKMERIVEENLKEVEEKRRRVEDEKWDARERSRMRHQAREVEQAERERPSLVNAMARGRGDVGGKEEGGWSEQFWNGEVVGGWHRGKAQRPPNRGPI